MRRPAAETTTSDWIWRAICGMRVRPLGSEEFTPMSFGRRGHWLRFHWLGYVLYGVWKRG
jgi:hypothetical protein